MFLNKDRKPTKWSMMRRIIVILILTIILILSGAVVCGIRFNTNEAPVVETQATVVIEPTESADVEENTITPTPTYTTKYTTTGLNIRTKPNTNCDIYKTVPINTALKTVDNSEKDGWIKIEIDNTEYYVSSKYLSNEKTKIQTTSRGGVLKASEPGDFQGYFTLTYYCACQKCCGKTNGITAWGTKATTGRTIATSSKYAFGTKLVINGHTYVVEDRGGAIKGNKIDVYVDSHSEALKLGVKRDVPVYIGK